MRDKSGKIVRTTKEIDHNIVSTACKIKSIGIVQFAYVIDVSLTMEWNDWSEFWRIVFAIRRSLQTHWDRTPANRIACHVAV